MISIHLHSQGPNESFEDLGQMFMNNKIMFDRYYCKLQQNHYKNEDNEMLMHIIP